MEVFIIMLVLGFIMILGTAIIGVLAAYLFLYKLNNWLRMQSAGVNHEQ